MRFFCILTGVVHIQQGEPKYNQFLKDGSAWEAAICSLADARDECDVTLPDSFTHKVTWTRTDEGGLFHAAGPKANVVTLREALIDASSSMTDVEEVAISTCTECGALPADAKSTCLAKLQKAGTSCTFEECASPALSVHLASGQCLAMTNFTGVSCADCGTLPINQDQCLGNVQKAGTSCTFEECASPALSVHLASGQCLGMANFDGVSCADCGTLTASDYGVQSHCLSSVQKAGTSCTFEECAGPALSVHLASGQCLAMTNFTGVSCADCGTFPVETNPHLQCLDSCPVPAPTCASFNTKAKCNMNDGTIAPLSFTGKGSKPMINTALDCKWKNKKCNAAPAPTCASFETKAKCNMNDGTIAPLSFTGKGSKPMINTALDCKWKNKKCNAAPPCASLGKKGKCNNAMKDCQWKNKECKAAPAPMCASFETKGKCNKASRACEWKKQKCSDVGEACSSLSKRGLCNKATGCEWKGAAAGCELVATPSCLPIPEKYQNGIFEYQTEDKTTHWSQCADYSTPSWFKWCEADSASLYCEECKQCKGADTCSDQPKRGKCEKVPGCEWRGKANGCRLITKV